MDDGKYFVYEWKIENLSFWVNEIHGHVITCSESFILHKIKLFPRGFSGDEEHLVVQISQKNGVPWSYIGRMTFISSDGSILLAQQVNIKQRAATHTLPLGPKFEKLQHQTEVSKGFQKDQLIIQLSWLNHYNRVEYICTTLEVFDASIKMSRKRFENLIIGRELISNFDCPLDGGKKARVGLFASEDKFDPSKIILRLNATVYNKNVSIFTRMFVLSNDNVVKTEKNEHVFCKDEDWSFSNSLTKQDVTKEEFSLILSFRFIPNNMYKNSLSISFEHVGEVATLPSNTLEFPSSSGNVPEEAFSRSLIDVSIQTGNSITALTKELMSLYQDGDYSDFELTCGSVSFAAHKAVLSARSPVFKSLLSSNLKEATSGSVVIEDLDPSTLTRFLAFLYTGTVEDLDGESAIKLYYAAEKYQVPTLKKECADFLCPDLSIANVGDVLSLADKTQDHELTTVVHDFILKNYDDVLRSEEWGNFMRSEPLLAAETLTHFSKKGKLKALP